MGQKTQNRMMTRPLPVKLTDAEALKYGREAARAMADKTRIETEFDSVKADYKAKIEEQTAIIGKLSPRIHSGIETRDVECEEVRNWTKGTVTVTRLDTSEVVESRPMREDEKQMEVTFGDEGKAAVEVADLDKVTLTVVEPEKLAVAESDPASEVPPAEVEEEDTGDTTSNPFA